MMNLPTLEARGHDLNMCFLYKLINGLAFFPNCRIHYKQNLSLPMTASDYTIQVPLLAQLHFFVILPHPWNKLPIEVVSSSSFLSFERACFNLKFFGIALAIKASYW